MKEIASILRKYEEKKQKGERSALATVVQIEGSSYRRIGARMIIFEGGNWSGGISGGCLEGDVLKKADMVMMQGQPRLVTYDTRDGDPYQIGVGLGCRGKIDIFIESTVSGQIQSHFEFLKSCTQSRVNKGYALVLNDVQNPWKLKAGDRIYVGAQQALPQDLSADLAEQIQLGRSSVKIYSDGNRELQVLHEVLLPRIHVIILGLHYDVPPMIASCREMFWKTVLIGDPIRFPKSVYDATDQFIPHRAVDVHQQLQIDDRTAVVLMSHDYKTDIRFLKNILQTEVPYIGLLGPRKRFDSILADLQSEGIELSDEDMQRIFSPVGLDIGAETPEEIALSIIAEIKAHFSKRDGRSLKYRDGTIYGRDR